MKVEAVKDDLEGCYCCVTDSSSALWSEGVKDSKIWFRANLGKHVEGYHLLDGDRVVGHVYWESSEKALISYRIEPKVAWIYCTELLREYMHKGCGKLMLNYMKQDLKKKGYKGIAVDATSIKEFMYFEPFQKLGFKTLKEHGFFKLMYSPLLQENIEAESLPLNYEPSKDKVEITLFDNFFCPVGVYMHGLIKKVAQTFGDKVKIVEIQATQETTRKYGTTDPLINGKIKIFGPATEKDIQKAIQEEIQQLNK